MICNEFNCDSDTVVFMSDFHAGNKNTDLSALERTVKDIRKNGYHVMILGDLCECITSRDKRFDMGTVEPEFMGDNMIGKQYSYVEKTLKPIADQILLIHCGNHDQSIAKYCHINMVSDLCESLGVKYGEYSALSKLTYTSHKSQKKFSYTVYTTHGYASGRMRGGKVNALESMSGYIDFDIGCAGHSHDLFHTTRQKMFLSRFGHLCMKNIFYGNTGSYLKGIVEDGGVSYPEMAGYRPLPVGYLKAILNPMEYGVKMEEVIM